MVAVESAAVCVKYKHALECIVMVDVLYIFRFLVEFNLYSWWYSDLTAKGKNALIWDVAALTLKPQTHIQ